MNKDGILGVQFHDLPELNCPEEITFQMEPIITTLSPLGSWKGNQSNSIASGERLASIKEEIGLQLGGEVEQNLIQSFTSILHLLTNILPEPLLASEGMAIHIYRHNLPIGGGLGSSGAFSVSLAGALLGYRVESGLMGEVRGEDVNRWAFASETILHGTPSGLDNSISCYGGIQEFRRGEDGKEFHLTPHKPSSPLSLLISNTNVPRQTSRLVGGVRDLFNHHPSIITPIFESIEGVVSSFLSSLPAVSIDQLTTLCSINHSLLSAIGVGHPSLDLIVKESGKLGLPSKLTGAGGGGCAFTVMDYAGGEEVESLLRAALKKQGISNTITSSMVGGDGFLFHDSIPLNLSSPVHSSNRNQRSFKMTVLLSTCLLATSLVFFVIGKKK